MEKERITAGKILNLIADFLAVRNVKINYSSTNTREVKNGIPKIFLYANDYYSLEDDITKIIRIGLEKDKSEIESNGLIKIRSYC